MPEAKPEKTTCPELPTAEQDVSSEKATVEAADNGKTPVKTVSKTRNWTAGMLLKARKRRGLSRRVLAEAIGAGFVPKVLNTGIYDEVFRAANQDAFDTARLLAKKEGISVGISSGAALFAAVTLAKQPENQGKVIVALLPDSGDRYYSTPLFTEQ